LQSESVIKDFLTTAPDGKSYRTNHYNLDVIISVGYRVKSQRGTQFRIWATQRLREYIIKGFALDDERLKQVGGGEYFDQLLARIRDIRSSGKAFFATVQNKTHWAAHGHPAAEIIHGRSNASQPNMGLTTWTGGGVRREDIGIAKNYLKMEEMDALNRIVTLYLDFAELQASAHKPMYMRDFA